MPTSATGKQGKLRKPGEPEKDPAGWLAPLTVSRRRTRNIPGGFTYIEVAVVLLILGIFFSLSLLRIDTVLPNGNLRLAARILSGKIAEIRMDSVHSRQVVSLGFDLDNNLFFRMEADSTSPSSRENQTAPESVRGPETALPDGVDLTDIVLLATGKVQQGEARIRFFPEGTVEPSLIHLKNEDGDAFSLEIQPLTGRVIVHDRYVEMAYAQ